MSDATAAAPAVANGAAADAAAPATAPAPSPELARLQARVSELPQEFESWTALVTESEKSKDVALIRSNLHALLEQFPLCFGYWQRLAKLELAQAGKGAGAVTQAEAADNAFKAIEAGLQAIPHSYELWTFYVTELMKSEMSAEHIRSVFVRGSSALSTDCTASPFWDKYLEFELQQFSSPVVQEQLQLLPPPYTGTVIGGLYALIISLPLKDVDRFWASFSHKFAVHYPLNYLASPEEAALLTQEYPSEIPEERRAPYTGPDGRTITLTLTDYVNEWEAEQRRALLAKREYSFRIAVGLRDEKAMFESSITRPYFHSAPLSAPELANWSHYLDFMEGKLARNFAMAHPPQGGVAQVDMSPDTLDPLLLADITKLYERCIIPCAKYAEFWDKYAGFMEGLGETQRAYDIRQRALFFLEKNTLPGAAGTVAVSPAVPPPIAAAANSPAVALAAVQDQYTALALLEEKQGRIEQARDFLTKAVAIPAAPPAPAALPPVPAHAMAVPPAVTAVISADPNTPVLEAHLALIHFERRQWHAANSAAASSSADVPALLPLDGVVVRLFNTALSVLDPAASFAHTKSFTYLSMQYAHTLLTQVAFPSDAERVAAVRAVYARAADAQFPAPVTTTKEVPATADGAEPTQVSETTVPRLQPSKQYALLWRAYIDFEEKAARAPLADIIALYERALRAVPAAGGVSAVAVAGAGAAPPSQGSSGLSAASRKDLWTAYVSLLEDRAASLSAVDAVKKAAKSALVAASPTTPPSQLLQSAGLLGKRKATSSPLPLQHAPKNARVGAPQSHMHRGGYAGGYGGGYGGGGGYQGGYAQQQQQQYGGYAAAQQGGTEHAGYGY